MSTRDAPIEWARKNLALRGVFMRESVFSLADGFDPRFQSKPQRVETSSDDPNGGFWKKEVRLQGKEEPLTLAVFHVNVGLRLLDADAPKIEKVAESTEEDVPANLFIVAVFELEYEIRAAEFREDAVAEFQKKHPLFHAWPYWREFVQSTCARLGIPPIPVPPLTLG